MGKDTTIGHFELAGLVSDSPLPTYPEGLAEEPADEQRDHHKEGALGFKPSFLQDEKAVPELAYGKEDHPDAQAFDDDIPHTRLELSVEKHTEASGTDDEDGVEDGKGGYDDAGEELPQLCQYMENSIHGEQPLSVIVTFGFKRI